MKRKSSARVEPAHKLVGPAAQDFVHAAADALTPYAQSAADRIVPLAHNAADRVGPLATQAMDRVTPYAQQAAVLVTPYAHQAVELVGPYAAKVGPYAATAKQRGAQAAHDAVEALAPKLDEAFDRVSPAVEAARGKVTDELLPRLSEALTAAAATPAVVEATKRGRATLAAARGDLSLPEPEPKKKGRWLRRLAVLAAVAGVATVLLRKLLGNKDADWQAARPTTPYVPSTPPSAPPPVTTPDVTASGSADGSVGSDADLPTDAVEASPQTPVLDDAASAENEPVAAVAVEDLPAAEPVGTVDDSAGDGTSSSDEGFGPDEGFGSTGATRYAGEGAYVGVEPPEGFVIKGNERSMKYHTPESGGYDETIAEVWFNSEEAAQEAGFVRAQG